MSSPEPGGAFEPQQLIGSWTHSFEEDQGQRLVFRPSHQDFPPARMRRSYQLDGDGTLVAAAPGPDDRTQRTPGTWSIDDRELELHPAGSSPLHFIIEEVEPDRLVLVAKDAVDH